MLSKGRKGLLQFKILVSMRKSTLVLRRILNLLIWENAIPKRRKGGSLACWLNSKMFLHGAMMI